VGKLKKKIRHRPRRYLNRLLFTFRFAFIGERVVPDGSGGGVVVEAAVVYSSRGGGGGGGDTADHGGV